MRRAAALSTAVFVYLLAAWLVPPGFFDGFNPPCDYIWSSPPPQAPTQNLRPKGGHLTVQVTNGVSEAASIWTDDTEVIGGVSTSCPQLVVGFVPGAFASGSAASVSVDIAPDSTLSTGTGLKFVTNVYRVTADAPLVKPASIELFYSNLMPPPSFVYLSAGAGQPWKSIGGQNGQPYTFVTISNELGYFAAGYPTGSSGSSQSTSRLVPILVAGLIAAVLAAGIPLSIVRRRRDADAEDDQ